MAVIIRERERRNGKIFLFLDVYEDGIRQQESTGLWFTKTSGTKREVMKHARELARKREDEIAKGKPIERSRTQLVPFLEEAASTRPHTFSNTARHVKIFLTKKGKPNIQIKKIDESLIWEWVDYILKQVSQNTAWNILGTLKTMLNLAVKEKIIYESPAKYVSIKKVEAERAYLVIDEVKKMADAKCGNPEIKRAFLFACYTGLRISDIRKLKWSDIKDDRIHYRQTKTGGFEYIPLNESAKQILFSSLKDNVIPLPDSNCFKLPSGPSISNSLKVWLGKAKIKKKITFHSSRHTFATMALTEGVDIYTVSKLLGHKELRNTQIYAKIIDSKLNEAVNKLPRI